MKKLKLSILLLAVAAFFVGCKPDPAIVLPLDQPSTFTVPTDGVDVNFQFNSNVKWSVTSDAEWATITPASGEPGDITIKITVAANPDPDDRTAKIKITAETVFYEFTITQTKKDAITPQGDGKLTVVTKGGEAKFSFTTNTPWVATTTDKWITIKPATGDAGAATISLTAAPSKDVNERKGTVKITAGTATFDVSLTQGQMDSLSFKKQESYMLDHKGGNITFTVNTNVPYTVTIDSNTPAEWLTVVSTKAFASNTVTLNVKANTTLNHRLAKFVVSAQGFANDTTSVIQLGANDWAVDMTTIMQVSPTAHVSMAVYGTELFVARGDENKVYVIDGQKGTLMRTIESDFVIGCIKNDDAGNIIVTKRTTWDSNKEDYADAFFEIYSMHPNGTFTNLYGTYIWGGTLGTGCSVRGNIRTKALMVVPIEGIPAITVTNQFRVFEINNGVVTQILSGLSEPMRVWGIGGMDPGNSWGGKGFWNTAANNFPQIVPLGTSMADGFILSGVYSENIVYKLGAPNDHGLCEGTQLLTQRPDGWAYGYQDIDVRMLGTKRVAVLTPSTFFPQWGMPGLVRIFDFSDLDALAAEKSDIDNTKYLMAHPDIIPFAPVGEDAPAGLSPSSDVAFSYISPNISLYYIDHNSRTIQKWTIPYSTTSQARR